MQQCDPQSARANLYSLIETDKANSLDSYAYLSRVFADLPSATTAEQFAALLPYPGLT